MALIVHIISWLIFGLVAGAIARLLFPGRQAMGCGMTAALGIVGSFVGGGIASLFDSRGRQAFFHPTGLLMSILGALVVLWVYSLIVKKA